MTESNGVTFLAEGDDLERGGTVEAGQVGIRLACGTEITDTEAGMAELVRVLLARFVKDPLVLITGNPVKGFRYYGPTPMADPGSYMDARTRMLEERDGEDWWTAALHPLADLDPIDGDRDEVMTFAEVKAAASGWEPDYGDGFVRRYGAGSVGKVRLCDGQWSGWVEYEESEDGPCVDGWSAESAMKAVDEVHAERPRR